MFLCFRPCLAISLAPLASFQSITKFLFLFIKLYIQKLQYITVPTPLSQIKQNGTNSPQTSTHCPAYITKEHNIKEKDTLGHLANFAEIYPVKKVIEGLDGIILTRVKEGTGRSAAKYFGASDIDQLHKQRLNEGDIWQV